QDFNLLGHVLTRATSSGSESWTPNEHGENLTHTDPVGRTTSTDYTPTGGAAKTVDGGDNAVRYSYDELDRVILKRYPAPDDRAADKTSQNYCLTLEYKDDKKRIIARRCKVDAPDDPPGVAVMENTQIFNEGHVVRQETLHLPGATFEAVEY